MIGLGRLAAQTILDHGGLLLARRLADRRQKSRPVGDVHAVEQSMSHESESGYFEQFFGRGRRKRDGAVAAMDGDQLAGILSDRAIPRFARLLQARFAVGNRPRAESDENHVQRDNQPAGKAERNGIESDGEMIGNPNAATAQQAPKTAITPAPAAMAPDREQNKIASMGTRTTHNAREPVPINPAKSPRGAAKVTADRTCARSNAPVRET